MYWDCLIAGEKTAEIRFNDRDFQKGDTIQFQVIIPDENRTWCPADVFEITHVLYFPDGLKDGYVMLSLKPYRYEKTKL